MKVWEYCDIKKRHLKIFAEGYLGHTVTNSELENILDGWDLVNHGQYFIPFGDFLREKKIMDYRQIGGEQR